MKNTFINICLLLFIVFLLACGSDHTSKSKIIGKSDSSAITINKSLSIDGPLNGDTYSLGDPVPFKIKNTSATIKFDSLIVFINDKKVLTSDSNRLVSEWNSNNSTVGRTRLRVSAFKSGKTIETASTSFILLSDIKPKTLHFRLINTFSHDPQAYTQGLVYENGVFYESTGEYGQSSLRKVDLKSGEVKQSLNLAREIFGEGLASYGNNLIQITWKSQVAFVYDKQTFKQISKFNYLGEGWGIAYDGKKLIMSNGSEILTYYDTEYFTELGHIEVCDDKEAVRWLNELEYINGEIYANIYQEATIAVIDPLSGKVKAYLNLSSLIPEKLKNDNDHVLNGIAYNPENGHLFVTGKNWPLLYEIQVY